MKTIEKKCCGCQELFTASLKEHNRGNALYCSRTCVVSARSKTNKEANCTCSFCEKRFYRNESKKANSKSGLMFCSRSCKDTAQSLEFGFTDMHPRHYGEGVNRQAYRAKAFKLLPNCCNECGYNKYPEILEVHHKDRNRKNSDISNLEILCSRCHDEKHFLEKTGKWG